MDDDDDDVVMQGVQIGTAVPSDKSKPVHLALKVKECEIYISTEDARDIARSIVECANYIDQLNSGQENIQ